MKTRSERTHAARSAVVAGLVVSMLAAATATATAEPPRSDDTVTPEAKAEAKALFDAGSRAFDLGEYERAIQSFEDAYRLTGAPALLLNIAQAHRLANNCGDAARFYRRFLEKQPKTMRRAEIEARRAEMEACESKKPAAPVEPATPIAQAAPPPATPVPPAKLAPDGEGVDPWRVVAWSGVALGTAGLIATSVAAGLALSKESELSAACRPDGGCLPSERDTLDGYRTMQLITALGGVVTVVGVGAAILGFVNAKPRRSSAASFELVLGAGQMGARGVF